MITLGKTLTSRFILNLREIGRVVNFLFFCPKKCPKTQLSKMKFLPGGKKVKVAVFDEEGEKGPQISCVSYANMCFESIGAYMDL